MREPAHSRTFAFNGGFYTQARVRRILHLSGHPIQMGWPNADDKIAIWGNSSTAHRGLNIAERTGANPLFVEDAFLRSLFPARLKGEAPLGLLLDTSANHFDPTRPSDLEHLLKTDPLDNGHDLQRARDAITRIGLVRLSKYSAYQRDDDQPQGGLC